MKLYPNQVELVDKMKYREENQSLHLYGDVHMQTNVSLVADPPGAGRKVSIRQLIAGDGDECEHDCVECVDIRGEGAQILTYKKKDRTAIQSTLIITKDIDKWGEVMEKELRVHVIRKRIDTIIRDDEYDVVICGKEFYNDLARETQSNKWKRFIYDNPIDMYIPKMKTMSANVYWIVTHDPCLLISSTRKKTNHFLSRLFCNMSPIKDNVMINQLSVKSNYQWKDVVYHNHIAYDIDEDHSMVPDMLESKQIVPLITILGGKVIDDIHAYMKSRHQYEINQMDSKLFLYKKNESKMQKWEQKKRNMYETIQTKSERLQSSIKTDHCSICLETFELPVIAGCCHQLFCGECLLKCLFADKSCPLCREKLNICDLSSIVGDRAEVLKDIEQTYPSRILLIENLVRDKMVIYAKESLDWYLKKINITFCKKGNIYYIGPTIADHGEYTDVIIYNHLSTHEKMQLVGSFNCIERTSSLQVHEFNI